MFRSNSILTALNARHSRKFLFLINCKNNIRILQISNLRNNFEHFQNNFEMPRGLHKETLLLKTIFQFQELTCKQAVLN